MCSRVRLDRDTLTGEPVALDLTLTAHSEVAECLLHVLSMAVATPPVNTNFSEKESSLN